MFIMSIGKPNLGEFGTILGFQAMTRFLKQIRNGNEVLWTGVGKRWAMMFTVVPPALGSPWFCGLLASRPCSSTRAAQPALHKSKESWPLFFGPPAQSFCRIAADPSLVLCCMGLPRRAVGQQWGRAQGVAALLQSRERSTGLLLL